MMRGEERSDRIGEWGNQDEGRGGEIRQDEGRR